MAIDPRQRYDDPQALLRFALGGLQAGVWTAMPGIVQSFDGVSTVTVQLAVQGSVQLPGGAIEPQPYPLLAGVPVIWPRGGGCTLTFPVAAGDECLVVFASRSIDWWWANGGINNKPSEPRMHDLSDGFALIGPFSQPQQLSGVSTTTVQLRSNDGAAYVELNPGGHIVNIVAAGGINVTGPLSVTGAVNVTGAVTATGDVTAGTVTLETHVHKYPPGGTSLTGMGQG